MNLQTRKTKANQVLEQWYDRYIRSNRYPGSRFAKICERLQKLGSNPDPDKVDKTNETSID